MDNTQLSVHVQKKSASGPNIRKKLPVTGLEGGRFCRYKNIGEKIDMDNKDMNNEDMDKDEKIVNRTTEMAALKESMLKNSKSEHGKVLMLYSDAGIGKARLIEEYIKKMYPKAAKLNIKIPASTQGIMADFSFFNAFFEQIEKNIYENRYSLNIHFKIEIPYFPFILEMHKLGDTPQNIIKKTKKCERIFKNYEHEIVIAIENSQIMDITSLNIFTEFLKKYKNIIMFMQYTTDAGHNKQAMQNVFDYIKDYSVTSVPVLLHQLTPDHAIMVISNKLDKDIDSTLIKEKYLEVHGNMDELLLYSANELDPKTALDAQIEQSLSKDAKYILYLILFYRGTIYKDELYRLLLMTLEETWDKDRMEKILIELQEKFLITIDNTKISINNSVIAELEDSLSSPTAYVAYSIVKEKSFEDLERQSYELDSLYRLIYLFSLFNSKDIISLLPYIKERLIQENSIYKVIEQIKKIISSGKISDVWIQKLQIGLVDILYSIGDVESAREELNLIFNPENLQHHMYRLAFKSALSEKDFKEYYEMLRKQYEDHPRIVLFCDYMLLYHKMKYSSSTEALSYAKKLLNAEENSHYLEYYFVLKNFSTYENNLSAIHCLTQCIDAFKKYNRHDLAVRTEVTLAMRYANIGSLDESYQILNLAHSENVYECRECYFLNNFAVIEILKGNFVPEVEKNLKNALLFKPSKYEEGIILCNLLIYYCKTSNITKATRTATYLEGFEYQQYRFEQYQHIIHWNLYYYYSTINDTDKMNQHAVQLKKLQNNAPTELQEYISATLDKTIQLPTTHRRYFYSKLPYRPDYIGYWQLEVPDFS